VRKNWRLKDPELNKVAVWTYYRGARRDSGLDEGATTVAYVPEKGWFWYIPQHNDMVSVGVVAEGKYLTREGVKSRKRFSNARSNKIFGLRSICRTAASWPIFFDERIFLSYAPLRDGRFVAGRRRVLFPGSGVSSGVMLALKSGVLAAMHRGWFQQG